MGALIVVFSALMAVSTLVITGHVNVGLVGVVLSYGLNTTGSLVRTCDNLKYANASSLTTNVELGRTIRQRGRAEHRVCRTHPSVY